MQMENPEKSNANQLGNLESEYRFYIYLLLKNQLDKSTFGALKLISKLKKKSTIQLNKKFIH